MAIVACRECGNGISSKALACPHCGAQTVYGYMATRRGAASPARPSIGGGRVQTVEQTGKGCKANQAFGCLLTVVGFASACGGASTGNPSLLLGGIGGIGVGFVWFTITRIVTWWNHG